MARDERNASTGGTGSPGFDGKEASSDSFSARLFALRALLAAPPDDDSIAERYNELLEAARGDELRLGQLRLLGAELRALQDAGDLPRTMIARAPRRRR